MPFSNPIREVVMRRRAARVFCALAIAACMLLVAAPASAQTAPVAVDDFYGTLVNVTLTVTVLGPPPGVLANDTDANNDPLTATLVTNVPLAAGSVSLASNGSFIYTPAAGFSGEAVFTYRASDDEVPPKLSNVATVTIYVSPPADVYVAGCVDESNGEDNNCTANDLTFVELGLGTQTDGCVNPADRLNILMRGVVQNTTAQTRYDVGMWFPVPDAPYPGHAGTPDPGGLWDWQIDPEGDGAKTGQCGVVGMMNPEPIPVTNACTYDVPYAGGALNLFVSGGGPWVNGETKDSEKDLCGGITANVSSPTVCDFDNDDRWDDSVIDFLSPLELDCNDADANGLLDGFVTTSVCLSWGNQTNQVDRDGDARCNYPAELMPGQKSKCRCEQYQLTNIPAPDLRFACPDTPTEVGGVVTMVFTYDNICSCTPDTATEYRFQCCTASFVEFVLGFTTSEGHVVSATPGGAYGTATPDDPTGTIVWRPGSLSSGDGIIPQSDSDTLTVVFDLEGGTTLSPFSVTTYWANEISGGALVSPVLQKALAGSCSINLNSTWANVSGLTADVRDGRTVVSWETSAEVGSVGFDVLRSDSAGSSWVKINENLVPAMGDGPGGTYQLVDDSAPTEGTVMYKVLEHDARGRELETRPVEVDLRASATAPPRDGVIREPRPASRRMTQAKKQHFGRAAKTAEVRQAPSGGRRAAETPAYVKIGVAETGLYRVDAADIAAALGESLSKTSDRIGQHKLALSTGGEPVAWKAEPDSGGILFYGETPDSVHDAERYYMLRREKGLAIEEAGQNPSQPDTAFGYFFDTVGFERNLLMRPFSVFEEDVDYWFWDAVLANSPTYGERTLEIELEGVAASSGSVDMKLSFVGFAPGITVSGLVFVNDHYIGQLDGPISRLSEAVMKFDQSYLNDGVNTVKITGRQGGMLIDRIEVTYERRLSTSTGELIVRKPGGDLVSVGGFTSSDVEVYDITDPLNPTVLPVSTAAYAGASAIAVGFEPTTDEGTYLVVGGNAVRRPASISGRVKSELLGSRYGADYLIITTADLESSAERLAEHRQAGGLETMVVDIEDIFDDFASGAREPGAITTFLAYATNHWSVPPRYVLLAGRGHYDSKDYMGYGGNLLPPVLAATSDGLIPSDNLIVDLDTDGLPDLAVGRLPVLSAAELDAAIDKIIAYENEATGSWSKQIMLAADDPDQAGDFAGSSDRMALAIPDDREVEKVYLFDPYPATEVNTLMKGALQEGIGIVNWTGHAGLDSLANEKVLTIADLESLAGTAHPSVVVGLTCLINNFGFPYFATLGEEMALVPGGGAIGVWAASGLSNNAQAEQLGESFMAALGGQGSSRLGDIILAAIDEFTGPPAYRKLVNTYVLFGDPALVLK